MKYLNIVLLLIPFLTFSQEDVPSEYWIDDNDFIVIHSIEENIEHLIPAAKKRGVNFKILVLKQDITTTGKILNILNDLTMTKNNLCRRKS